MCEERAKKQEESHAEESISSALEEADKDEAGKHRHTHKHTRAHWGRIAIRIDTVAVKLGGNKRTRGNCTAP